MPLVTSKENLIAFFKKIQKPVDKILPWRADFLCVISDTEAPEASAPTESRAYQAPYSSNRGVYLSHLPHFGKRGALHQSRGQHLQQYSSRWLQKGLDLTDAEELPHCFPHQWLKVDCTTWGRGRAASQARWNPEQGVPLTTTKTQMAAGCWNSPSGPARHSARTHANCLKATAA